MKSLDDPDERAEVGGAISEVVELGDLTVGRTIHPPGWRWSTHVRPHVGGEWCQVQHVGMVISGRLGILLADGSTFECGPGDVYDMPPGHDGYTIGHEPAVAIEWTGVRAFTGFMGRTNNRVLATILFTDMVGSSTRASELGDAAWNDLLSSHFQKVRTSLDRFRGHEVTTTGDGILATFSGPAQALHCAVEIRSAANAAGLHLRVGVHVGEVELIGSDVRGIAVHEAQRVMGLAGTDEILVSETTRVLALASGLVFEDRGLHELKGLPGEWRLFALAGAS